MKRVKGILVATSLAVLFACESDKSLEPSLDGASPVGARSPQTVDAPYVSSTGISETRIDITWSDVSNETGYEVYRSANQESGVYALLATTAARVWSYSDTQAGVPAIYCYKVRALRVLGSRTLYSAFSNSACTLTSPMAPSNVTATLSSYKIAVAWQDNSNIEAGLQLFASESEAGPFALRTTLAPNVVAWLDDGVRAGARYCYRLRAFRTFTNDNGNSTSYAYSTESNTACATIPPPSQPPTVTFQISATPFSSSGVVERARMISAETQPWSVGYQIRLERSLDGGTSWSRLDDYSYEYWDYPLTPDVRVCYRVIASNEAGDGQPSNTGCTSPPAAPTNLTMTSIDPQSVELTWSDNSAVEDGYQVWLTVGRGHCSCGASACDAGWDEESHLVATLPANTTRYVAPPLFGDVCTPTTSSYYIVAIKDGGTSDWSNGVSWDPAASP